MNKIYLQEFFSELVETLPEHLSLQLQSNFPGVSNCYKLTRSIRAVQTETGRHIVFKPGGHYSIVRFGVSGEIIDVSLCVLESATHEGGELVTGIDLTALAVCQCDRVDNNYLHLFCDPYSPEYPPIEFPEISSIN